MKKVIACVLVLSLLCMGTTTFAAQKNVQGRGGLMGFIAGCCFGIRAAGDYNSGKEIHALREWLLLVPVVGIVIAVWNGIDRLNGVTKADLAAQYGAMYY